MDYSELCDVYDQVEKASKRLDKTLLVSRLIRSSPTTDLAHIILLLQGRVFPPWDSRELGLAAKLIVKAIASAYGIPSQEIEKSWSKQGDLGLVAESFAGKKKQTTLFSSKLHTETVFSTLQKLASLEGLGTVDRKLGLVKQLLSGASPLEAKYVIRTILQELRVGLGAGSIRDAIVWAFFPAVSPLFVKCQACSSWQPKNKKCVLCGTVVSEIKHDENPLILSTPDGLKEANLKNCEYILAPDEKSGRDLYNYFIQAVQHAYDVTNDFGEVAAIARKEGLAGLQKVELQVGKPVKVMLAQKVKDVNEGFERLGKPLQAEFKYDGFRMQIHKTAKGVTLFTRRLEDVTNQFPEVKKYVQKYVEGKDCILDAEAVGMDPATKKYRPFQEISQRIRRKYNIDELSKKLPVELNVFDIILHDGKSILATPLVERRKLLSSIVTTAPGKIVVARGITTDNKAEVESFYKESLSAGNEGLMLKKLDAPYKPGSRVGFMVKLKPVMDTLDVVIVGAEWGEGKRSSWFTSFTVAIMDENDDFVEIGKVGTGIKELEGEGVTFNQLTELLKPLVISEKGKEVRVKPTVVLELHYEEIQKSPTYSSGYALRFPRVINLRVDRSPEEISTLYQAEELYQGQK